MLSNDDLSLCISVLSQGNVTVLFCLGSLPWELQWPHLRDTALIRRFFFFLLGSVAEHHCKRLFNFPFSPVMKFRFSPSFFNDCGRLPSGSERCFLFGFTMLMGWLCGYWITFCLPSIIISCTSLGIPLFWCGVLKISIIEFTSWPIVGIELWHDTGDTGFN